MCEAEARCRELTEALTQVRKDLLVAKSTVDGWTVGLHGRVTIHKDVISKAINAGIATCNQAEALLADPKTPEVKE
jgi:hypothetical protein